MRKAAIILFAILCFVFEAAVGLLVLAAAWAIQ